MAKTSKFERLCFLIAGELEIEITFYYEEREDDCFEDDGTLHVRQNNERAAFDVSSSPNLSGWTQNRLTRRILEELGMAHKIGPRVLVTETEEEEEE